MLEPPAAAASIGAAGVFVVFEGGEGSGKSTQARLLAERVAALGRQVTVTREPGGSPRAEQIRELILADADHPLDPRAEALLFAAARADHVTHTVRPTLERGDVVLSDRYVDSSVAYQGVARALGADWIREVSGWATQGLQPDLTVILDIDPAVGLARAQDANRLERESAAFHDAVRAAFLQFAAGDPDRYVVVAADQPAGQVTDIVWQHVAPLLEVSS